jgi:hypothetical protein
MRDWLASQYSDKYHFVGNENQRGGYLTEEVWIGDCDVER